MRAQVLTAFGGPSNFEWREVAEPTMTEDQVLIEIAAVGVNSLETKIRNGWLNDHFPTPLPAILGKELSGTIARVGANVAELAVGDRVAGFADSGVYAQRAVARPEALAHLPAALTFEQAASLPVAIETATRSIALLGVGRGDTVVVNGASGAVGSAAVQLLGMQGVTVIGIASSANHAYLASLGAIPIAYGDDLAARIRGAARTPVTAAFDVAGHSFAATAIELTGSPARVVTIADFAAAKLGIHVSVGQAKPVAHALIPILALAATGSFSTHIDQVLTLGEIAAAHELVERGHVRGKIIVRVDAMTPLKQKGPTA